MRQPPSENCKDCPLLIRLLDACPLTPFISLIKEDGLMAIAGQEQLYELFMVLASLVPWIFACFLFYKLCTKRDLRYLIRTATHLLAHITCDVVKVLVFREDRPDGACSLKYGLPSCHSIFAGLYMTWILIEVVIFHMKFKRTYIIAIVSMGVVPYSRIFLNYHTLKQCLYGWSIGTIFAIIGSYTMKHLDKRRKTKVG